MAERQHWSNIKAFLPVRMTRALLGVFADIDVAKSELAKLPPSKMLDPARLRRGREDLIRSVHRRLRSDASSAESS